MDSHNGGRNMRPSRQSGTIRFMFLGVVNDIRVKIPINNECYDNECHANTDK